jgi:hypothetical protein
MTGVNEKGPAKRLGVYGVIEREDKDGEKRTFWPRIGTAFVNHDGSLTLLLDSFPLGSNKIQVREVKDDARPGANGGPRRGGFDVVEVRP